MNPIPLELIGKLRRFGGSDLRKPRIILMWLVCSLAISPAVRAAGAPSDAPAPPLTLPQYVSELDRWTHAVQNAPEDSEALKALRKTVPPEWNVAVDGAPVRVSTSWLTRALYDMQINAAHRPARIEETQAHLATLRHEAASLALAPRPRAKPTKSSMPFSVARNLRERRALRPSIDGSPKWRSGLTTS